MSIIIWFIASCISTFGITYLYYKLSHSSRKITPVFIVFFLIGALGVALIEYFDIEILNYIFFFLYFPFLFQYIKKLNFKKLIFYIIAIWLCGVVVDLILMVLLSLCSGMFDYNIYTLHPDTVSIVLSLGVSVILIILGKLKIFSNFILQLYNKTLNIKYYDFLLIVFTAFISILGISMLFNIRNLNVNLLLFLIIFLTVIIFILLIRYKIVESENVKYLQTLKENNDFYIKMYDEHRVFKHNLIAKLLSIKSVSNKNAIALIDDLVSQYNKDVNFSKNIKDIPYGFNGIIYQKIYEYQNLINIKIYNSIEIDIFEYLRPRRYNVLVEKTIVALDNAIESCLNSLDKVLIISLYEEDNNIVIEIKNTFSDDICIDDLGNKDYTTKGKKRGVGLFSILRNSEATLKISLVNNFFIAKIIAKKQFDKNNDL